MPDQNLIKNLVALDALEQILPTLEGDSPRKSTTQRKIRALRKELPEDLLPLCEARARSGRRLIAPADGFVCRSCHISVPGGIRHRLLAGRELLNCGNCGTFLYLEQSEVGMS